MTELVTKLCNIIEPAVHLMDKQIKEQAAVIEQMREALDSCTPGDYSTGHVIHPSFDTKLVEEAIALQPCPEVLNKVRAEAVRKAATDLIGYSFAGTIYKSELDAYAQRIEKGEA